MNKIDFDCKECVSFNVCKYVDNEEFDKFVRDIVNKVSKSGYPFHVKVECAARVKNEVHNEKH